MSNAAVSFALNGKPGVSERTRARVLKLAEERGWAPSMAARALSGGGTGSVGMVLARGADDLSRDAFHLRFIAGLQAHLSPRDLTLTFQLVDGLEDEERLYRRWSAQQRIDGVIVVDLCTDDPRPGLLNDLRLPAVLVGAREHQHGPLPAVWAEDEEPTRRLVNELVALGHRSIGYISGPPTLAHTAHRLTAYAQALLSAGLSPVPTVSTSYRADEGRTGLMELLEHRVTAVIVDSDELAIGVLRQAGAAGLEVPGDLSIISWEDSALCEAATPTVTALRRDPFVLGRHAAAALTAVLDGLPTPDVEFEPAELVRRDSLGPAPPA